MSLGGRRLSLASGRFARRFPGFRLAPTRGFWVFMVAVPVLGVAALNTGNNSLYLLLATALGAFVASGWSSRHTLAHLTVELQRPAEAFAGTPVTVEMTVRNSSRLLPAATVVLGLEGLPGQVVVPLVPCRGSCRVALTTIFPVRGRVPLPSVVVEVRLPLPFFVKSSRQPQEGQMLVYPRRLAGAAPRWAGLLEQEQEPRPGAGRRHGEVQQLREFHPGDDRRDIHWKQTARQQRLIVMERRERARPSRYLVLDRQLPVRGDEVLLSRFEDLISEICSAAVAQARSGWPIGLVLGGSVIPAGSGARHARRLLEALALVQAVGPGEDPLPASLREGAVYRLVAS